jgi:hypothetical protein
MIEAAGTRADAPAAQPRRISALTETSRRATAAQGEAATDCERPCRPGPPKTPPEPLAERFAQ